MASVARRGNGAALAFTLSAVATAAATTDLLKNGGWTDGTNCVDQPWGADYAYLYGCHGASNQQWQLTSDGRVQNGENQCFTLPDDGGNALLIAPCDASRPQHWFVSDGQIKPQGVHVNGEWVMRIGTCVDASQPDGRLVLHGCHGGPNQKFVSTTFPLESQDVLLVQGPWANGLNCVDYDFNQGHAYVYACHGQDNQRWSFTAKDELRVMGDKCLEYDDAGAVRVRPCTGAAKQKWVPQSDGHVQPKGYQATNGSFVSMDTKCLDASLDTGKLYLYDCIAAQANQKFVADVLKPKAQDLITVDGPWAAGSNCVDYNYATSQAYVYSCHGRANQLWQLTPDSELRAMMDGVCLTLDAGETTVYMAPCGAGSGLQQWRATSDGRIQPLGYRAADEWRSLATRCLTATVGSGVLALAECVPDTPAQVFRSRAISAVRDHVYALAGVPGRNCVATNGARLEVVACGSARAQVWEFSLDSELRVDGKCLSADTVSVVACDGGAAQKWKPTANGEIVPRRQPDQCLTWAPSDAALALTLTPCDGASESQRFSSNVFSSVASGSTAALFEKAASLLDAVLADSALSARVVAAGAAVVEEADRSAGEAAATRYLLQFVFGTATLKDYSVPTKVLYSTAESKEFLVLASVLMAAAETKGPTLVAMLPFTVAFSDALYAARREVLWDRVLHEDVALLEASADGALDDFDALGGALVAVCRATPLDLAMCALAQYFQLMDQWLTLRARLAVEGASAVSDRSLALAASVAQVFVESPLAQSDPLWTRIMTLFMFRAPYVGVLPDAVVARASAPELFLPTFLVYARFRPDQAAVASIEAQVRLLSDQVTAFHYAKLLAMVEAREMEALDAYMTTAVSELPLVVPINNLTTSDFPVLALFVAPHVCDDLVRAPLSLCQLETFHDGLQAVLRFERQRRSNVVALDNVLEVDVRKKLDVIDQEKKQYEILSTLQSVANQVGATVTKEMAALKTQLAESTAVIRRDIEATRQSLRGALQAVGAQLLDAIDESTRVLYAEVGAQAAAIRHDIFDSTRQLSQRLDDTGRALLGAIEDSKQELKYQIGAEAERTRGVIAAKTEELKRHMSNEASGLREFIDAKSNQIIGVVREEGRSTRVYIDQKTNQIINVVRDESEQTRQVVRTESQAIQRHIDVKSSEIIGVVREEGGATRQLIVEKTAELKTHVTNEATGIKDSVEKMQNSLTTKMTTHYNSLYEKGTETQQLIVSSTAEVKGEMRQSADQLRDIYTASCVESETAKSSFTLARERYQTTTGELQTDTPKMLDGLMNLGDLTKRNLGRLWIEKILFTAASAIQIGVSVVNRASAMAKAAKAGKVTTKAQALDLIEDTIDGVNDLMQNVAELDKIEVAEDEMKRNMAKMSTTANTVLSIARNMPTMEATDPMRMVQYSLIIGGDASWSSTVEFATNEYSKMKLDLRQNDIGAMMRNVYEVLEITCKNVEMIKEAQTLWTSGGNVKAIDECHDLKNSAGGIADRLRDAIDYMDAMRGKLAVMAASALQCKSSNKTSSAVISSSKPARLRHRALQSQRRDVPENQPYYVMAFAALTKVILDYRLQEAAYEFCKFYEYRNGGVAPPMCASTGGSSRMFFTLGQVLEMRAWSPPIYNTVSVRGLLPTKAVYSDVHQRFYPHVDLERLRRGEPVYFALPTWDAEWLKKYGWLSATASSGLPSIYLESIALYVPLHTDSSFGDLSSARLSTTVRIQTMDTLFLSQATTERQYLLPSQTFTTDAIYGAAPCPAESLVTNPYDLTARCVQDDATSDVCVRRWGTTEVQNEKRLLPSLFSTWRLSADFTVSTPGALDVLVPKPNVNMSLTNGTASTSTAGELLLIADATIVQVTGSVPRPFDTSADRESAVAATGTCCAPDEFRVSRSKCQKCQPGMIGAAHGYACVPI